jgi:hypothetical protein
MRRLRQLRSLHAHAFGVAHQMRRAVDPHFIAGRHQDGFQRAAGGAFAIGARDGKDERRRFHISICRATWLTRASPRSMVLLCRCSR